jgi:hypothetical protein
MVLCNDQGIPYGTKISRFGGYVCAGKKGPGGTNGGNRWPRTITANKKAANAQDEQHIFHNVLFEFIEAAF